MSMLLLVLSVIGYATPPQPTPESVTATEKDLKQGWLCVDNKYAKWKGKKLTAADSTCLASAEEVTGSCDNGIALKLDACWLARDQVTLTGPDASTLTVKLPKSNECLNTLDFNGDIIYKANVAGKASSAYDGTLYYENEGHLAHQEVKAGKLDDADVIRGIKTTLLRTDEDRLCVVDKILLNRPAGPTDAVKAEAAGTPATSVDRGVPPDLADIRKDPSEHCRLKPEPDTGPGTKIDGWRRRRETICMSMDDEGRFVTVYRPRYLLPGQQLRLVVHIPSKVRLRARQEGTIGGESELDDQVTPSLAASQPLAGGKDGAGSTGATTQLWIFEGRAAGLAPIIIEEEPGKEAHRIEIDYPRTYLGSIRVGFGLVGGGAVGPQYSGVQRPGSATYEVVEKTGGKLAFELVLAYSVYPEAMLGGRNYQQRLFSRNNWGVGPLIGVGVVSVSGGKFDVFKSLYLGLEFEPVRYFSVSAGPVLRRVDRLADGYQVGSAVTDANVPTKDRIGLGWFVMFNVTPRFMKTNYSTK